VHPAPPYRSPPCVCVRSCKSQQSSQRKSPLKYTTTTTNKTVGYMDKEEKEKEENVCMCVYGEEEDRGGTVCVYIYMEREENVCMCVVTL